MLGAELPEQVVHDQRQRLAVLHGELRRLLVVAVGLTRGSGREKRDRAFPADERPRKARGLPTEPDHFAQRIGRSASSRTGFSGSASGALWALIAGCAHSDERSLVLCDQTRRQEQSGSTPVRTHRVHEVIERIRLVRLHDNDPTVTVWDSLSSWTVLERLVDLHDRAGYRCDEVRDWRTPPHPSTDPRSPRPRRRAGPRTPCRRAGPGRVGDADTDAIAIGARSQLPSPKRRSSGVASDTGCPFSVGGGHGWSWKSSARMSV